jgi:hypothetical protein
MRLLTCILAVFLLSVSGLYAQKRNKLQTETLDSIYISEIEDRHILPKVLHAEPLYIDLIRDLGARKGEKEWNVGTGLTDNNNYDEYLALVEYEWAVADRLGLEVELPFSFYYPVPGSNDAPGSTVPRNKLNGLKLAAQWSFLVSEKAKTSLALGYIHEFEMTEFRNYGKGPVWEGNLFNPFFVAAKRWGENFHSLLYTGPQITQHRGENELLFNWQINSSFHYMIPGTRNFVGVEFNKELIANDFDMTIRPQMRLSIADNLMVGIVSGIPIARENQRFSSFVRIIYEPGHRH